MLALEFLVEWWLARPRLSDDFPQFAENVLTLLRRATKDLSSRCVRESAATGMFVLLEHFAELKSSYAPMLFKTLVYTLVDSHSSQHMREML